MSEELIEQLQSIDRDILAGIVRKDKSSKNFDILEWSVEPVNHTRFNPNTGELYRFFGLGRDESGEKTWDLVLKVANYEEGSQESTSFWKREALACQNCLLDDLPGPIAIPRCYDVVEYSNQTWIWMEHVVEIAPKWWGLDHYAMAASSLSHFNAAYLKGEPLPDFPWLCKQYYHALVADNSFWHNAMDSAKPDNVWEATYVKTHFPDRLREQIEQLWKEKEYFLTSLDKLPQVFCHNDFHRRNLMIRSNLEGLPEVITLDWHFSGNGPLGGDLGWLIGGSLFLFERDPFEALELFDCCLEAYQAGLVEEGLGNYRELALLGCLISIAIMPGMVLPAYTNGFTEMDYYRDTAAAQFGRTGDDLSSGWATVVEFCMKCADDARQMIV